MLLGALVVVLCVADVVRPAQSSEGCAEFGAPCMKLGVITVELVGMLVRQVVVSLHGAVVATCRHIGHAC